MREILPQANSGGRVWESAGMTVPQLAVLLGAASCFASYGWGLARFFTSPSTERRTFLVKLGTTLSVIVHIAAIVWFYRHGDARFAAAMAIYALSLWLFWWAVAVNRRRPLSIAYSLDAPQHLMVDGPYALVRHPLYVSYELCWVAGVVATGQWALLATVLGMGWLYHDAARAEEAKFARSGLAGDYARYAARTGRYFPRLPRR